MAYLQECTDGRVKLHASKLHCIHISMHDLGSTTTKSKVLEKQQCSLHMPCCQCVNKVQQSYACWFVDHVLLEAPSYTPSIKVVVCTATAVPLLQQSDGNTDY